MTVIPPRDFSLLKNKTGARKSSTRLLTYGTGARVLPVGESGERRLMRREQHLVFVGRRRISSRRALIMMVMLVMLQLHLTVVWTVFSRVGVVHFLFNDNVSVVRRAGGGGRHRKWGVLATGDELAADGVDAVPG